MTFGIFCLFFTVKGTHHAFGECNLKIHSRDKFPFFGIFETYKISATYH